MPADTRDTVQVHDLRNRATYNGVGDPCDVVMKGGVTSGIVYPLAICELARAYRFRNIGGTSAGAIAAAATAAAEYGRDRGGGSFAQLADLPAWLSTHSRVFSLFQPQPETKPLFDTVTAPLGPRQGRYLRLALAAIRSFPLWAVIAASPGILLLLAAWQAHGIARAYELVLALLLILLGSPLGVGVGFLQLLLRAVPANFYGLCSGYGEGQENGVPPLIIWLTELLNELAGKDPIGEPLTFGDLWGTNGPQQERAINLEVMTTCLTQGRPYRLPFETNAFFFNRLEFERLFPPQVVKWMVDHPRPTNYPADQYDPIRPMPAAADLPVVVAARLSLSFPLLMSAVPLYAIDYSLNVPEELRKPERCWFSDGGITSNLPVHFFDAPLPRWPTFAINLREFHPSYPPSSDECKNVYMPETNNEGIREWWTRFDAEPGFAGSTLFGFLASIIKTMQNWVDNTQLPLPGYRDRIAHVCLRKDEGGTNLKMTAEVSRKLSERGRCAGEMLSTRFAVPPPLRVDLTWDNHRWVRYRSIMVLLENMLQKLESGYQNVEPRDEDRTYQWLINRTNDQPPSSYPWMSDGQREFAGTATSALMQLADSWGDAESSFAKGAPSPFPELRIMPRL